MWIKAQIALIIVFTCAHCMAFAQSAEESTKKIQDRWIRCLKDSYQIYLKQTSDRNAAAETAFRACITDEEELSAYGSQAGVPRSSFDALKSTIKQGLVEGQ